MTSNRYRALAGAVFVAALVAGCGGDDKPPTQPGAAPPPAPPQAKAPPVPKKLPPGGSKIE